MSKVKAFLAFASGCVVGAVAMFKFGYYTQRLELVGPDGNVVAADERGPTESFSEDE